MQVAPFAGAWIEIFFQGFSKRVGQVAPFAGAWIEIVKAGDTVVNAKVAPFAGAWIEICVKADMGQRKRSLPSRERGLKFGF